MLRRLLLVFPLALTFLVGAPVLEGGRAGVAEAQRSGRVKKSRSARTKAKKKARRPSARRARQKSLRKRARPAARRKAKRRRAADNPLRRAKKGAARAGKRAARATGRAGRAAKRAGKRAGRALKRGGQKAGRAIKRGGKRAGRAIKRGGAKAARAGKRVGRAAGRAARASWRTVGRAGRAAKNATRLHLGKRAPVRRNLKEAKKAMREGRAGDAARELTKAQLRKADGTFIKSDRGKRSNQRLGLRERFALWRARFSVKRKSRKLLNSRTQAGDLAGVEDAVASLEAFEASGHMGAYARYKANSAKRESFRKTALALTAQGDLAGAEKALGRALELTARRGAIGRFTSGFKNRKAARQVFDQAMAMTKHYAKSGRPDLVAQASDFAAQIAVSTGLKWRARRLNRKSPGLMKKANRKLLGTYLKESRKLYRSGDFTGAAYTFLAAKEIPVKRSFRQRRLEKKIRRNLGNRLDGLSLADLQQAATQQGGAGAEMGGGAGAEMGGAPGAAMGGAPAEAGAL